MSKPLDKMLKNELVAMVQQQASRLHAQDLELAQLRNDAATKGVSPVVQELLARNVDLESKLAASENRRKYESIAYRKKIKAGKSTEGSKFAARIAAKRAAREAYFRDYPHARTCTDADLVPYLEA